MVRRAEESDEEREKADEEDEEEEEDGEEEEVDSEEENEVLARGLEEIASIVADR